MIRTKLQAFSAVMFLVLAAGVSTTAVAIKGEEPRKPITVTAANTALDRILQDIGRTYGFDVRGLQHIQSKEAISITLSGSLEDILGRLLRNQNYMLVRSPDNPSGIEKVIIIETTQGEDATATVMRRRPARPAAPAARPVSEARPPRLSASGN
jgi:hypothetical protein